MRMYLVSVPRYAMEYAKKLDEEFPGHVGVLGTYQKKAELKKYIEYGYEHIMVDSGAYSVLNSGVTIHRDDYLAFIREYQEWVEDFINLDVIGDAQASFDNWIWFREQGHNVIPVYHFEDPWEHLEYYCDHCDFICLGGLAGTGINYKSMFPFLDKIYRTYPHKDFHLLGVNNVTVIQQYPFFSCDALSWKVGTMYGLVITPQGRFRVGRKDNHDPSMIAWLKENGIDYPFPDDFDYKPINLLNIRELYKQIVLFHEENKGKINFNRAYQEEWF